YGVAAVPEPAARGGRRFQHLPAHDGEKAAHAHRAGPAVGNGRVQHAPEQCSERLRAYIRRGDVSVRPSARRGCCVARYTVYPAVFIVLLRGILSYARFARRLPVLSAAGADAGPVT